MAATVIYLTPFDKVDLELMGSTGDDTDLVAIVINEGENDVRIVFPLPVMTEIAKRWMVELQSADFEATEQARRDAIAQAIVEAKAVVADWQGRNG